MQAEKFTNTSMTVKALLGLIEANDIAIPEIQRPFVWRNTQVRDLMDSLYKGYPTGYIIVWKNPNVKLKDGSVSAGKKVIIDGQQRITALMTAIAGREVLNKDFKLARVKIAFNPFHALEYINGENDGSDIFAVQTPAHIKSSEWIPDIADIFATKFSSWTFIPQYLDKNPTMDGNDLQKVLDQLKGIETTQIGVIELSDQLDIDVVTDIFIRINSKGTALSQGDFVMSKLAADEVHDGNTLRKIIDYFSHLSVYPEFYKEIAKVDTDFANTSYYAKLAWLHTDNEKVYDPTCDDVIRVAFMYKTKRARLAELVQLLSGRDFESRDYKEDIADDTYKLMFDGVESVVSQYHFTQFMMAIHAAGFISPKLVNSYMAIDFAYTVYHILNETKEVPVADISSVVSRWYVLSVLTGRYSSSPESQFYQDLRLINEKGVLTVLKQIEDAVLSDNFWEIQLVQQLETTSTISPVYQVYLAAQVKFHDLSLLSDRFEVSQLISEAGDVHHVFPKQYLINNKFEKNLYNQVANYAFLSTPVNISVGKKAPCDYFSLAKSQCMGADVSCGSIYDLNQLYENLKTNCIPLDVFNMDASIYEDFLAKRRSLMAAKIRRYYETL